jgi:hypothetical protein
MNRSVLGHILPEAMVCYLENYSADKFAEIFLGEFFVLCIVPNVVSVPRLFILVCLFSSFCVLCPMLSVSLDCSFLFVSSGRRSYME